MRASSLAALGMTSGFVRLGPLKAAGGFSNGRVTNDHRLKTNDQLRGIMIATSLWIFDQLETFLEGRALVLVLPGRGEAFSHAACHFLPDPRPRRRSRRKIIGSFRRKSFAHGAGKLFLKYAEETIGRAKRCSRPWPRLSAFLAAKSSWERTKALAFISCRKFSPSLKGSIPMWR